MKIFNRLHLRYSITIILFLLTYYGTNAQSSFAKVYYDDNYPTEVYSIVETGDTAYIMVGYYADKPMVFKIDTLGNIVWSKTIGTNGSFFDVIRTYDSAFVVAGTLAGVSATNFFCVKINTNGDTLWTKEYDFGGGDILYNIEQTNDNGFVLIGVSIPGSVTFWEYSYDYLIGLSQIIVAKLDSTGSLVWSTKIFTGNYSDKSFTVKQTPDSNYIVSGYMMESSSSYKSIFFLMKLTSEGNILWLRKHDLSSNNDSKVYDILVTDSGYLFTCYFNNEYFYVVHTDFEANILQVVNIPYSSPYGGYGQRYLRVHSNSNEEKILALDGILKLDSSTNIIYYKVYFMLSVFEVIQTYDSCYLIVGNGPFIGSKLFHRYIGFIKTDPFGLAPCNESYGYQTPSQITINFVDITYTQTLIGNEIFGIHPVEIVNISDSSRCIDFYGNVPKNNLNPAYTISPNPSGGIFQITLNDQVAGISEVDIYNSLGTRVMYKVMEGNNDIFIDMRARPKGIYYLRLIVNDVPYTEKIVIY